MISEDQKAEVAAYLLAKKLPVDIMLEVQDHFISQIISLKKEEQINFKDAFEKVKQSWHKELKLSWKGEVSLEDSTDFMRKMSREIIIGNVFQAVKMVIPYVGVLFWTAHFFGVFYFKFFFIAALLMPLLYAFANYMLHYEDFKLPKKYHAHVLTLHQNGTFMFFLVLSPMFSVIPKIFQRPEKFQEMFQFLNTDFISILFVILSLLLYFTGIAYSIIAQKKYLRQITGVKIFLKNHPLI